ncbi:ATP-dependent endonuclease [Herbaspirillum sp. AP02]|uniref:ATP-dependent nuclease n=1 Tax=unclassified Herbaspirillum TaxID=2624150 RepID=UPI0015DB06EB|nr:MULTISPECIES: ATP-dependent endonuclease [unclassified Herbaspirillum]MBG7621202.1 ATP-dependent endonuclease [Herbaspirillum sp. AP02]NZD68931.1 ATP-dependent endonuclease [Herbaspirillum sp. AP21]
MKIQSVSIKNFRTLVDVTIPFDSVTTFIGPNGVGKSTVLRALDWYFNGKAGTLSEADCSFGDTQRSIEVRVTFCDLSKKDREALGKYAPAEADTFTAWKSRSPEGIEMISANAKGFSEFEKIKAATTAGAKKALYAELRNAQPELNLPSAGTAGAVDQAMMSWESAHIDMLSDASEGLQTNFFGFNSEGKMSGLFDFVLITADLRASEESSDTKSSIISRILERSVDRAAADSDIARIVEDSRARQQAVYEEKFKGQLEVLTRELNTVIAGYSPGRSVAVTPAEIELKASRTTFEVAILDGKTETQVERQGHGFQRTLLISALQLLAQSGAAATEGVICLAIEEPELFQHPIQAQTFSRVLRSLAEDPTKRVQVTYATHSPYFIESRRFGQVRRLDRVPGENPSVQMHFASISDVKKRLNGVVKPNTIDQQLDGMVANQLATALFAHRAFLVEGTTESAVFHGIGDRRSDGSIEAGGTAIVPVLGKSSLPLAHTILSLLGVPVYSLFDADANFAQRAKSKGKSEEKIEEERRSHVSANRTLLRYFNIEESDFPKEVVTEKVAIFEDHLESYLEKNWAAWCAARDSVESETGMKMDKNQNGYRIATKRAQGDVPEMLVKVLEKAEGK